MNNDKAYLVTWSDLLISKAGVTSRARWTRFLNRGARAAQVYRGLSTGDSLIVEQLLSASLWAVGHPAFSEASEAVEILGGHGEGWSECYRFDRLTAMEWAIRDAIAAADEHLAQRVVA